MKHQASRLVRMSAIPLTLALVCIGSVTIHAQETGQYDHGTPPQHAAGVSSLGSYTSADLGTINLGNGSLNIKLPLGSVGGRGFSLPLTLNYSSKVWSASRDSNFADETGNHPVAYAVYADIENLVDIYSRVAPGWTIGAAPTIIARGSGIGNNQSTCSGDFNYALTKLTVILPDKGEIQLRDDVSDGAPLAAQAVTFPGCFLDDGYRGRRWHATDGSGIVFISDNDNGAARGDVAGVLITADGTRYRFINVSSGYGGSVDTIKSLGRGSSITDRSGNMITISYPASNEIRYTDQLGRITKIQQGVPDPQNPSVTVMLITLPGYQGQPRYIKIKSAVMNQRYRSGINPTLPVINGDYDPMGWGLSWGTATRLFLLSHGLDAQRIDVNMVLSEFILPDGRSLQFFYNEFGEVAEVQMPTGGKVQYDYQYVSNLPAGKSLPGEVITSHFHSNVSDIERAVVARRTYPDGVTKDADWSYSYTLSTAQVTATSGAGVVLLNQKHYFLPSGRNLYPGPGVGIPVPDRGVDGSGYNLWSTGVERRSETLDAAGSAVIAAGEQDWSQRAPIAWTGTNYASYQTEKDNRVNEERKIFDDGSVARVTYLYDLFNNPTETSQFDYDNTLKRRTVTSYSSTSLVNGVNYADDSIRLIRLPLQQSVYDGAGVEQARTLYEYDIYTGDGNHDYLLSYASITGHDTANYGLSRTARGNATRIDNWLKSSNTYLYTYPRYDIPGNVVSTKDPNGNVASVSFADDFGDGSSPGTGATGTFGATYALPTLITSPPPNAGAQAHTARSQYDFSTGLLSGFKDRNGVITQTFYNDAFDRPTQVKSALGISGVESHAAIYYAPATAFGITLTNNDVLTAKDQTTLDDAVLRSWTKTDGFGRTVEGWSRDPQGDDKVVTIYDALGRTKQVSNPFRPSLGETPIYAASVYDFAGRVTSITTPDSAVVTSAYSGNTVTVTDQTGKARKSVTDGLGRLIQVYEDPTGLNYLTSYNYDTLDNLTTVSQGVQTRTFAYDSLKRLTSATNPESGTITYQYDNNGNLLNKTDARNIVSNYVYDALNRVTTILYRVNGQPDPNTGDVEYLYDNATNGKGRPWLTFKWGAKPFQTAVGGYDALGRVTQLYDLFGNDQGGWYPAYSINRTYDLAGHVLTETYPSGRIVTNAYDSAGRTTSVTGNLGDGTSRTYSTGINYSPFGGITREQYGTSTPLYHKTFYNIRGQMFDTRLSSVNDTWDWNRGRLILYYSSNHAWGGSGPDNNGNVIFSENWVPPPNATLDQAQTLTQDSYTYDALNRLSAVNESSLDIAGGGPWISQFAQSYSYDSYGNRTINQANTWGTGIPKPNFGVDSATNRLSPPAGYSMTYDQVGNLTNDTYTGEGTRTYDAENRMKQAWANNQWQTYTYDGDGRRVRRNVNGTETWQVYGLGGELLAEYAANAAASSPQKEYGYRNGQLLVTAESSANIHWLVSDQLGTPRMIADLSGSLSGLSRHDYLPFGEELFAGTGGRTTGQGYTANDNVRQHFTRKERDNETGLDYFLARYYSSTQGRFTSADRIFYQADMQTDPQRFNLYSNVRNNPLRFIDPTGEAIELLGTEEERKLALEAIKSAVGEKAGKYLYENKVDGKYYVGIYSIGPGGKGKDFKDLNSVAGELAPIINDSKIVGVQVVEQGTQVGKSIFSTNGDLCKCNSTAIAGTTIVNENYFKIYIPIPKPGDAYDRAGLDPVDADQMESNRPGKRDIGITMGHDLGHARALMTGAALGSKESNDASLRLENKVRTLRGPTYSQREYHGSAEVTSGARPM